MVRVVPGGVTGDSGDELQESFDVHLRKIRSYKGRRGRTYTVRWTVAGVTHPETFKTLALAESRLAELRTYARNGVAFDVATGLPVPEVRQARAEAAKARRTVLVPACAELRRPAAQRAGGKLHALDRRHPGHRHPGPPRARPGPPR